MPSFPSSRIAFLDWLRGLAAVIMLQGHVFHAYMQPSERENPPFIFSQFFGGQAAAIFLFLTGVTYGLGMDRREYMSPGRRVVTALKRGRYLFLLAFLFRVQTFAFSWPHSPWSDLLRVDVLNLMGATATVLAVSALFLGLRRVQFAAAAGVVIATMSPIIANSNTSWMPSLLRNYLVPSPDFFGIFPWGAYLAFGLAAGSAIPLVDPRTWSRVMQWAALVGFALLLGGQYFSNLPYSIYANSDFWLNSPALVSCKLGITLLLGSGAFLWTEYLSRGWSFVQQLGTTSLLVYWVHVELTYGRWFTDYKQRLTLWQTVAASIAMIALMVGVSVAYKRIDWRGLMTSAVAKLRGERELTRQEELEEEETAA